MIQALKKARSQHRRAIELLYEDMCSVIEYRSIVDEKTHITKQKEVIVYENLPCRISFSDSPATDKAGEANKADEKQQKVLLFIAPEITINPGSKIKVLRQGKVTDYNCSGVVAVYTSHQEINLKLFERWC